MKLVLRGALLASATLLASNAAFAATDNQILETRLKNAAAREELNTIAPALTDAAFHDVLRDFAKHAPRDPSRCVDARTDRVAGKYAVSYDAQGKPCRIYDLSFPTMESLFQKGSFSKVPVQSFGATDYLNWMNGNYQAVLDKISGFPTALNRGEPDALAGWVKKIEFKKDRVNGLLATATVRETGLPASFSAADLEIGKNFRFSEKEQARLKQSIAIAARTGSNGQSLMSATDMAEWNAIVERPEALLEKIKFNWDDVQKVYNVALEGQFLPIRGPIALVDYSATYKTAVERTLRSLLQQGFGKILPFIPGPAQRVIGVVVNDAFMFVNTAYDYQINQLENSLRKAQTGTLVTGLDAASAERGMNILHGGKADIVQAYMLSVVQKKPFNWNSFEEIGRTSRYATEKSREIMLTNLNSQMTLKNGCQMTLVDDYFGLCTKNGKHDLHSLISTNTVLFWNLGGPMVYQYETPSSVTLKRSATYVLSAAAYMIDLPIVPQLTSYLANALRSYATAGITDQAFLHNSLYIAKLNGSIGEKDAEMNKWMYLQNINPFLPKSAEFESRIIDANAALLQR
ncbi:MAG: hypothetical protein EOP11_03505 [Proteobacteria bacterium]|nr:MAG: hypothetical protein EOP11_03505 [Pseudomonadota bacterium]